MPTSVVEVFELSRKVVKTKQDNAKLADRNNDLVEVLDGF